VRELSDERGDSDRERRREECFTVEREPMPECRDDQQRRRPQHRGPESHDPKEMQETRKAGQEAGEPEIKIASEHGKYGRESEEKNGRDGADDVDRATRPWIIASRREELNAVRAHGTRRRRRNRGDPTSSRVPCLRATRGAFDRDRAG